MYSLQKYKGKSTRHICPCCDTKQSFTLYVNNYSGLPLDSKVGKCNRESKCGYHYPPKQYFIDNPTNCTDVTRLVSNTRKNSSLNLTTARKCSSPSPLERAVARPSFIPLTYIEQSQSQNSNFITFLKKHFSEVDIEAICNKYLIGATRNKEVVFWQVDVNHKIRTGKIMQYNKETGKRIKHKSGAIDWVHNKLKHSKQLPENFNLQQCFFGEHLLSIYDSATVAIVESEKSAIIASIIMPELIWLASGGIQGLSVEKCQVLNNRNVILFPDLGAYEKWRQKAKVIKCQCHCIVTISSVLENISTTDAKTNCLDVADYMITQLCSEHNHKPYRSVHTTQGKSSLVYSHFARSIQYV